MDLKDTDRKKREILIVYNSVLKHSVIMFYRIITHSFIYIHIYSHTQEYKIYDGGKNNCLDYFRVLHRASAL